MAAIPIDADDGSDWIKTLSWDLPTDPLVFLMSIAPDGEWPKAWRDFQELPARKAMPPEMAQAVEQLIRRGP